MADYLKPPAFSTVAGVKQVMTARWLNRNVENTHFLATAAYAGGQPFRSVTMRAPFNMGTAWNTPEVIWSGYYRHVNHQIVGLYTAWRSSTVALDTFGIPDIGSSSHVRYATPNDLGSGPYYLKNNAQPTTVWVQIEDDPIGHPDVWSDLVSSANYSIETIDHSFTAVVDGFVGLNAALVENNWYRVRVVAQNGAVTVTKLYGENVLDAHAYLTLPSATNGVVLTAAQWNRYIDAEEYGKAAIDSPASACLGVLDAYGSFGDSGASYPSTIWTGRIRHFGKKLHYRIGARGWGFNSTISQQDGPDIGVVKLYLSYGTALYDLGTNVNAINAIYPRSGYSGDVEPTAFMTGAKARLLSYRQNPGDDYVYNVWRFVEGEIALADVGVPGGIPYGDWYDVIAVTSSAIVDSTDDQQAYFARVDFVGETNGDSPDTLLSEPWQVEDVVDGSVDIGVPGGQITAWKADLENTVLPACDRVIQILTPDLADWQGANVDTYPSVAIRDAINEPSFIRQRPLLHWAGGTATVGLTLLYGDPNAPKSVNLGWTPGTQPAILDLRTVKGLDVGTVYWLSPRELVRFAAEAFE